MKKQHWVSFELASVNLTSFGMKIPAPFSSLTLSNSEIQSSTAWKLSITVGGDADKNVNIAAFEALLYSAAQAAANYPNTSGTPVTFAFGWLDAQGRIADYISYQGFMLKFQVSTSGLYMNYTLEGYASRILQTNMPVLKIPELSGFVQPSAVVEALAKAVKADSYYQLDIDHNDAPTYVSHGALNTSFNSYVRGDISNKDDYDTFPGLLSLSKSYNASREASGLKHPYKKLSSVINNRVVTPLGEFLQTTPTDTTPQCNSFSYWVDEPTMTSLGAIHYKSNAGLLSTQSDDVLQYGTANTNIISLSGNYDGVAYNITNMDFASVGFTVDGSGNQILQDAQVVNSWSATLDEVFQSANIINDINAVASQFTETFDIQIPGSLKSYSVAQPVSLLVVSGRTVSPITGIYRIMSVSHTVGNTFTTSLKLQRLDMGSANQVATSQGILISGTSKYPNNAVSKTKNIISTGKVDFGTMYPTFEHLYTGD